MFVVSVETEPRIKCNEKIICGKYQKYFLNKQNAEKYKEKIILEYKKHYLYYNVNIDELKVEYTNNANELSQVIVA